MRGAISAAAKDNMGDGGGGGGGGVMLRPQPRLNTSATLVCVCGGGYIGAHERSNTLKLRLFP